MKIYCTGCGKNVTARLTDGKERYPHRLDLAELPFWKCDKCGGYVGCHHKTKTPTKPLGYIATPEMYKARVAIHDVLDPLWRSGKKSRGQLYAHITKELGRPYHTGEIKTMAEARRIYRIVAKLNNELLGVKA